MKRLLVGPLLLLSLDIAFNPLLKLNKDLERGLSVLTNGQNRSARVPFFVGTGQRVHCLTLSLRRVGQYDASIPLTSQRKSTTFNSFDKFM